MKEIDNIVSGANEDPQQRIRRMTRRSLLWGALGIAGAGTAIRWISTQPLNNGIPWPLRRVLGFNAGVAQTFFRPTHLAPEYPGAELGSRQNGDIGLDGDTDADKFSIRVLGLHNMTSATKAADEDEASVHVSLADLMALPAVSVTTEMKCIEGWSQFVQWKGARFADFAAKYGPATTSGAAPDPIRHPEELLQYVALETPDGAYYVGLDLAAALHPQTLLCYEMNGKPLEDAHGAPVRLVIPVKYGVKNLKRIGLIRFTAAKPKDYWAEQGYDWYAGL